MDLLSLSFSATSTKCGIALCVCTHTTLQQQTDYTAMHAHMFVSLLLYYTHLFMEVNSTLIFFNREKRKGVWVPSEATASCYTPVCSYGIAIITTTIITLKTLE